MKQIIIEISENQGRVRTAIRDGAILNPTPIENGIHNYLGDAIQQIVDGMFNEAEAVVNPNNQQPATINSKTGGFSCT